MVGQVRRRIGSVLLTLLSFALFSCGGQVDSGSGTLQVSITDLPSAAYNSVTITVTQINAITVDGAVGILSLENPVSVNVLDYRDHALRLGQGTIAANAYNQLRLVLAENPATGDPVNYVTLNCSALPTGSSCDPEMKWPLKTPSGQTSGLKISLPNDLVVPEGGVALLTIDFAPDAAIVERGDWDPLRHDSKERFLIEPTGIRILQEGVDNTYGVLFGNVLFADNPAPVPGTFAVVTAIDPITQTPAAATLVAPGEVTGDFRFFLDAGDYDLQVKADGYQALTDGPFNVSESDTDPHPETDAGLFSLEPLVPNP